MPAGDIWEERAEPPGTYMSPGCTFSSASPGESVSCFSPSPFPNATERSAPGGSEPRRALPEARVLLPGLAHRPRRAWRGKGPGRERGDARPLSPTAAGLSPTQPPPSAGLGQRERSAGTGGRVPAANGRHARKHRQEKEEKEGMDDRAGERRRAGGDSGMENKRRRGRRKEMGRGIRGAQKRGG